MSALPAALVTALDRLVARTKVVVASDFDGVLAPLVDDPMSSRPLPGSIDTLVSLADLPGVTAAIVSGRDLATLRLLAELPDDSPVVLIGSHGAETSVDLDLGDQMDDAAKHRLVGAAAELHEIAAGHPDVRIEHKPVGVVLHTRGVDAAQAESATAAALRIPDSDPGIHAMRGKDVVELSVVKVSKGVALHALSSITASEATLYLGDDVTDEKAFAVLQHDSHVTVKVGEGPTSAQHRVGDPAEAVAVLREVLERRTR